MRDYLEQLLLVLAVGSAIAIGAKRINVPYNVALVVVGLVTQEPDYLQFRVGSGTASLDLRRLAAGHTVELATPQGAFTIERTGYYRVEVEDGATKLTARRGGVATLSPASGPAVEVAPSEQVVVSGEPETLVSRTKPSFFSGIIATIELNPSTFPPCCTTFSPRHLCRNQPRPYATLPDGVTFIWGLSHSSKPLSETRRLPFAVTPPASTNCSHFAMSFADEPIEPAAAESSILRYGRRRVVLVSKLYS